MERDVGVMVLVEDREAVVSVLVMSVFPSNPLILSRLLQCCEDLLCVAVGSVRHFCQ